MVAGTLCAPPVSAYGVLVAGDDNEDLFPVWSYDAHQGKSYELPVAQAMEKVHGNFTGFFMSALHIPSRCAVDENRLQRLADACVGKLSPRATLNMLEDMDMAGRGVLAWDELLQECTNLSAYSRGKHKYVQPTYITPYHVRLAAEMTDVPIITLIWTTEITTPASQPIYVMNMTVRMPDIADSAKDDWTPILGLYDKLRARLRNGVGFRTSRQRLIPSVLDALCGDFHVKRPWRTLDMTHAETELFDELGSRERWLTALSEAQEDTPLAYLIKTPMSGAP
jgi:hypothetical protein